MCLIIPQLLNYWHSVSLKYKTERKATVLTLSLKSPLVLLLSHHVYLCVSLLSLRIRIIICYASRVSVRNLLACTQPIILFRQNTRAGFHKENQTLLNSVVVTFHFLWTEWCLHCTKNSRLSGLSCPPLIFHGCLVFSDVNLPLEQTFWDLRRDRMKQSGLDLNSIVYMGCVLGRTPQAGLNDSKQWPICGWKVTGCPR